MQAFTLQPVKRIEIVLLQEAMTEVTGKLVALGVTGYSIIDDILGRGESGLRTGTDLGAFQYQYLLIACEEARVGLIIETVGPYLKRFGGLCLISEAQRLAPACSLLELVK